MSKIVNIFRSLGLFLLILFSACSSIDISQRESGALIGGAVGAGLGAVIGNQSGNSGAGVAIGSGIGLLAGGLIGNQVEKREEEFKAKEVRIDKQDQMISENQRLIQELRSKGVDAFQGKRGVIASMPDVLFEFNSAEMTSEAVREATEIANIVRNYPDRKILVEGHTDSVGTMVYNQRLSEGRARSVADELVAQGVSRRRVVSAGFGESRPVSSNLTERGRTKNRRVEVVIK